MSENNAKIPHTCESIITVAVSLVKEKLDLVHISIIPCFLAFSVNLEMAVYDEEEY